MENSPKTLLKVYLTSQTSQVCSLIAYSSNSAAKKFYWLRNRKKFRHFQRPINDFIAVDLLLCFYIYIVSVGKPTFMMILNQMMDILWQTEATVANGTTRSAWTFKLKCFKLWSITYNWNALFAENKLHELYNLYNENKWLICGGLMGGEILNSPCLDFFWNSLFEVVFILNSTFAVVCYHGATVTLRLRNSVLIFSHISRFQRVFTYFIMILWCWSLFFLRSSPAFC